MKILFMGTPDFAVFSLNALIEAGHEICGVVTQPDKPKGRGYVLTPPPVKVVAEEAGIPVYQPATLKDGAFEETLRALGASAPVTVTLGQERYPTRAYEGFCFPSGEYLSLQVRIGEAEGQNWWCVLFPSLCLSVAEGGGERELEEAFLAVGLTPEQYRIITESDEAATYRLRFKFLEMFEQWQSRIRRGG